MAVHVNSKVNCAYFINCQGLEINFYRAITAPLSFPTPPHLTFFPAKVSAVASQQLATTHVSPPP